jgi:hypothetical protein
MQVSLFSVHHDIAVYGAFWPRNIKCRQWRGYVSGILGYWKKEHLIKHVRRADYTTPLYPHKMALT